jgi:hypothetical protein
MKEHEKNGRNDNFVEVYRILENHSIKLYTGLSWNAAENESFFFGKCAKTSLDYHKTN